VLDAADTPRRQTANKPRRLALTPVGYGASMAVLLTGVFLAVAIALLLLPGTQLIGLLFIVAAVVAGIWALVAFAKRGSGALRSSRDPGLLGPGGPDDRRR
jgi:UPF0716 family protein affecting phage T7 exclusion